MHYTVEYVGYENPEAKADAAIADCKKWLGKKQFAQVVRILQNDKGQSTRQLVLFGLAMQGIQGYPAEVMVGRYWTPQRELI